MTDGQTAPRILTGTAADSAAATRAVIYALLGEALTYPRGEVVLRLLEGDWLGELRTALTALPWAPGCPETLALPDDRHAIEALEKQYSGLFDVLGKSPRVSLLERSYVDEGEQALWQSTLGFYRHFGLDFSQGYAAEQPDHLLTELAFMHYLCFLEAGARTGADAFRRGQRDFLRGHLGRWSEALVAAVTATELSAVYTSIVTLLATFVAADLDALTTGPAHD